MSMGKVLISTYAAGRGRVGSLETRLAYSVVSLLSRKGSLPRAAAAAADDTVPIPYRTPRACACTCRRAWLVGPLPWLVHTQGIVPGPCWSEIFWNRHPAYLRQGQEPGMTIDGSETRNRFHVWASTRLGHRGPALWMDGVANAVGPSCMACMMPLLRSSLSSVMTKCLRCIEAQFHDAHRQPGQGTKHAACKAPMNTPPKEEAPRTPN
jgi:hypothetical protein